MGSSASAAATQAAGATCLGLALQHRQSAALAVAEFGSCAFSGRARRRWAALLSKGRGRATRYPVTATGLAPAASKVVNSTAFDHPGFANDDIYYLEVCLISQVCANSDQLFRLQADEDFICQFTRSGFDELKSWLLNGPSHG